MIGGYGFGRDFLPLHPHIYLSPGVVTEVPQPASILSFLLQSANVLPWEKIVALESRFFSE